jgi:hypothetical protein
MGQLHEIGNKLLPHLDVSTISHILTNGLVTDSLHKSFPKNTLRISYCFFIILQNLIESTLAQQKAIAFLAEIGSSEKNNQYLL